MTPPVRSQPRILNARWTRIGIPLLFIYLVTYMDRTNVSIAAPAMSREFQLGGTATGLLLAAFFWGYVLTMVPGGWIAARTSAIRVIIVGLTTVGITACLTGLMPTYELVLVVRFIMGLAEGVIFPAFTVLFFNWFPGSERGRAVTLSQMSLPLASIISAPVGGWLITSLGFHWMFIIQGVPCFVLAALFAKFASDDPTQDRRLSKQELEHIVRNRDQETTAEGSFRAVLKMPVAWVLGLIYFLWASGTYGFSLWMPTVISDLSKSGIGMVGVLSALPFIFGLLAMVVNAFWSDRSTHSRGWFVCVPLGVVGSTLLIQHFASLGLVGNMIFLCLTASGVYAAYGIWWTWVMSKFPKNNAPPTVGMINVFGNFGGIVAPPLLGLVGGASGPGSAFYVLGIFALVATTLLVVLSLRDGRRAVVTDHPSTAELASPDGH